MGRLYNKGDHTGRLYQPIGQFYSNNSKDYIINKVKRVIDSCMVKEHFFPAMNYIALASNVLADSKVEYAEWCDYFGKKIWKKINELQDLQGYKFDLAKHWVQRRY